MMNLSENNLPLMVLISPTTRCNLKCKYCYVEASEETSQTDLNLSDAETLYKWLASYSTILGKSSIKFTWFGGEPTLKGHTYFSSILELQKKIFNKSNIQTLNMIQTNFTLFNDKFIEIAHNYFDSAIGGSFDAGFGERVFPDGRDSFPIVETQFEKLRDAGIQFGVVCTLTKNNVKSVKAIYDYFKSREISFQINRAHVSSQSENYDNYLSIEEYNSAMMELFDYYVSDTTPKIDIINFSSMIKHYIWQKPLITCTNRYYPEEYLGAEASGRIYAWCRFGGPIGNYLSDTPEAFLHRYRNTFPEKCQPGLCVQCEFYGTVCQGPCPSEPKLDCHQSQCGYRTAANQALWRHVVKYYTKYSNYNSGS